MIRSRCLLRRHQFRRINSLNFTVTGKVERDQKADEFTLPVTASNLARARTRTISLSLSRARSKGLPRMADTEELAAERSSSAADRRRLSRSDFPPGFVFGVATSAYQVRTRTRTRTHSLSLDLYLYLSPSLSVIGARRIRSRGG